MPTYYTESFSQAPLPAVVPAYVYVQYNDDPYVTAFFTAYNELAQGYLNWFNETPLPVWTSPSISGGLLDFIGTNLYGTARPVISTVVANLTYGAMGTRAMDTMAMDSYQLIKTGTAQPADDDLYKRTLTWIHYKGDGYQATIEWLRRRIARFLYGANGGDIDVGLITNVSISATGSLSQMAMDSLAMNAQAMNSARVSNVNLRGVVYITIPSTTVSQYFIDLFTAGYLPAPFQMTYKTGIA